MPTISELSTQHHLLAKRLALGKRLSVAIEDTTYTLDTATRLSRSPLFQRLISFYREKNNLDPQS